MFGTNLIVAVVLVLAVAAVEIPPELQEYIDELHSSCIKKTGITEEDHSNYDIKNKDHKMMCYMKCLMLDSKWMAADGTIQYDFIKNTAHEKVKDILVDAVDKCRDIQDGADLCEKSYHFIECMFKADPENWFFV